MSLINDLVIEVDRRQAAARSRKANPTRGLAPAGLRRTSKRSHAFAWTLGLTLTVGCGSLLAFAALRGIEDGSSLAFPGRSRSGNATPAVSAAPTARPAALPSAEFPIASRSKTTESNGLESSATSEIHRPSSVREIGVEVLDDEVVVRIEVDGPAAYHTEASDGARQLEVAIEAASGADLTRNLDLTGTPIRTVRSISLAGETTLVFEFDGPEDVQARWSEEAVGAVLELSIDTDQSQWSVVERSELAVPAKAETTASDWTNWVAIDDTRVARDTNAIETPTTTTGHSSNASTGDRRWSILRSSNDRARLGQETLAREAEALMTEARLTWTDQRPEEALALYEQTLELAPDNRRALVEISSLYTELGRTSDAIRLVRAARLRAPRDAELALLHARLIGATGDLGLAIQILDGSAQSTTEAPEIHALAAAYLQQKGEFELAIDRYERLLRRYPGEARWWMGLGISFEAAGRDPEALDVYRIATQLGALPPRSKRWVASRIESLDEEG